MRCGVKSSASFWLITAAMVAGAAALESRSVGSSAGPAPLSQSQSLQQFLRSQTDGEVTAVKMRKVMSSDWTGWRFRVRGCPATAIPLPTGGDFDIDARRQVKPGERLMFVYRGRLYDRAPIALASVRRVVDRVLLPRGTYAGDYYIGLIGPVDCAAPFQIPWGMLPVYGRTPSPTT